MTTPPGRRLTRKFSDTQRFNEVDPCLRQRGIRHPEAGTGSLLVGIVVDGVAEVFNLTVTEIEDPPDFRREVATPYLLGMARVKFQVKIPLDIDQVLSSNNLQELDALADKEGRNR